MEKPTFFDRLSHAWNAFQGTEKQYPLFGPLGAGPVYNYRPGNMFPSLTADRNIVSSIYNRIAVDVARSGLMVARVDQNGNYLEQINSGLNTCLTQESNIDQTAKQFLMDVALSMFDEGVVAIVPVDTDVRLNETGSFDVKTMRTGKIVEWYPQDVKVNVYNEMTGERKDLVFAKRQVAIVVNPLYSIMNEPNSTLKRLISKLAILDAVDKQSGSGKLDLIIQLPYVVKTETKEAQAQKRRKSIEDQIAGSKYGIAYIDGSERITQLNRPVENNLLAQIQYLTDMLHSELGISKEVMNGTADEQTMLNYYNSTVDPIVNSIADAMNNRFLTKTAKTQGHKIIHRRDPFQMVPVTSLAEIADKFTRNEILTGNEIRGIIGFRPVDDPSADELRNKNVAQPKELASPPVPITSEEGGPQNGREV